MGSKYKLQSVLAAAMPVPVRASACRCARVKWCVLQPGSCCVCRLLTPTTHALLLSVSCASPFFCAVSPSFSLAFSDTMPAFANGLGYDDDRAIELRPGDSIDVEAFGVSWKDATFTAVYLEASSTGFTNCNNNAVDNTRPNCWEQRNHRAKAVGLPDDTWLYIGNAVADETFVHKWTLPAYGTGVRRFRNHRRQCQW